MILTLTVTFESPLEGQLLFNILCHTDSVTNTTLRLLPSNVFISECKLKLGITHCWLCGFQTLVVGFVLFVLWSLEMELTLASGSYCEIPDVCHHTWLQAQRIGSASFYATAGVTFGCVYLWSLQCVVIVSGAFCCDETTKSGIGKNVYFGLWVKRELGVLGKTE